MPLPLPQIPTGSNVFIDANIFVYGINQTSAECHTLLERCSREDVVGICSYSVVLEATHQFMMGDARAQGHRGSLKGHPEIIRGLRNYWIEAERLFALNLLFLEAETSILRQAQLERQNAGLRPIDSVIVACMREYGIETLASNDGDFEHVHGIQVFGPTDLPA
jgi:predicted nucleic acid-binding protein